MHEYFNPMTEVENKKEIARECFKKWNEALLSKDPKQVADLYSDSATFLPTLNGTFKHGGNEAKEYFEHFLQKNPTGEIVEDSVQKLSDDSFLHSGHYNFELGPETDRKVAQARFSFAWQKNNNGDWKIIHHHSSVKPE